LLTTPLKWLYQTELKSGSVAGLSRAARSDLNPISRPDIKDSCTHKTPQKQDIQPFATLRIDGETEGLAIAHGDQLRSSLSLVTDWRCQAAFTFPHYPSAGDPPRSRSTDPKLIQGGLKSRTTSILGTAFYSGPRGGNASHWQF